MALLVKAVSEPLDLHDGTGPALIGKDRLHVLHVNHLLRGQDSDEDEAFVCATCAKLEVPCTVRRIDVPALMEASGDSNMENVARRARYAAAHELAERLSKERRSDPARARILTAHTANDRVETFFMRAIEGASVTGLASIRPLRGIVARPLLECKRDELRQMLTERGYTWREDATNDDTTRFRAFVRHEIVPLALSRNPAMVDTLAGSLDVILDEDAFLQRTAHDARTFATVEERKGLVALDSGKLARLDPAIARRVVFSVVRSLGDVGARFDSRHVHALLEGVSRRPFAISLPGGIEVRREFDDLVIRNVNTVVDYECGCWLRIPGVVSLAGGRTLSARLIEVPPGADPVFLARSLSVPYEYAPDLSPLVFDADKAGITEEALVSGSACLRVDSPQDGDSMQPFGMRSGSKKVLDILAEARIPLRDRARIPVVRTHEGGPVVCIAGIRLDRRVQCGKSSSRLVELSIQAPKP